ncbi:hypothetical protein J4442_02085 [Candidatus Woesearchaeota archaeon]|nr:hypothetical protein [Candidatus Woesearchaeota archaeon]
MNKKILLGILILTIFISGCGSQGTITGNVVKEANEVNDDFFCKSPYIEYQKGSCCLDNNNNGICDDDDSKEANLTSESCPFECPENRVCEPVYKDGSLIRWACA